MADSTIAAESVILLNNWPDGIIPDLVMTAPDGGFTGSAHHNVVAAKYQIGTMSKVYSNGDTGDSTHGWSTLMYAQTKVAVTKAFELFQPALATDVYAVSSVHVSALIVNGISMLMACSISAMTDEYYGWFLVGGVAPADWIAAMDGDYPTNDSVAVGQATCGSGDADTQMVLEPQTAGELDGPVAWCLTVDA